MYFLINLQKKKANNSTFLTDLVLFSEWYKLYYQTFHQDLTTRITSSSELPPQSPSKRTENDCTGPFQSHNFQKLIIFTSPSLQLSTQKQQKVQFHLSCYSALKKVAGKADETTEQWITDHTWTYLLHKKNLLSAEQNEKLKEP